MFRISAGMASLVWALCVYKCKICEKSGVLNRSDGILQLYNRTIDMQFPLIPKNSFVYNRNKGNKSGDTTAYRLLGVMLSMPPSIFNFFPEALEGVM